MPLVYLYSRRENEVQRQGGLNWGHSDGNVCTADAYIALNNDFFRQNPDFFPERGSIINVVWDDNRHMTCLLEGSQVIGEMVYPKQISTDNDKSLLGEYLRNRLGVSTTHLITRSDLQLYGREDIDISYDQDNDVYLFDFSV